MWVVAAGVLVSFGSDSEMCSYEPFLGTSLSCSGLVSSCERGNKLEVDTANRDCNANSNCYHPVTVYKN